MRKSIGEILLGAAEKFEDAVLVKCYTLNGVLSMAVQITTI